MDSAATTILVSLDQDTCQQRERESKRAKLSGCPAEIPSNRECEDVPAPTRFIRRSNSGGCSTGQSGILLSRSHSDPGSICRDAATPTVFKIDDDVWRFCNPSTPTTHQAVYYVAHRQHVAGEIRQQFARLSEPHSSVETQQNNTEQWNDMLKAFCNSS
jgi:hypothetical protein